MFFSRSSATFSSDEPTFSFRHLSLSHDDTPTSSPKSDPILISATSFSAAHALLITSSDESTSSFHRLSISHNDTPLCWSCNAVVHGTNFLIACHVRRFACASCRAADFGGRFSGPGTPHPPPIPALCPSCRPADPPCPFSSAPTSTSSSDVDDDDDVLGVVELPRPRRLVF